MGLEIGSISQIEPISTYKFRLAALPENAEEQQEQVNEIQVKAERA